MENINDVINSTLKNLVKQQEIYLLEQINEFVSRGLIVIEQTQPILIQDPYTNQITLNQSIRLVLKDQEYVQKLETENKELKEKLETIKKYLEFSN